jgi:hypothetical protein
MAGTSPALFVCSVDDHTKFPLSCLHRLLIVEGLLEVSLAYVSKRFYPALVTVVGRDIVHIIVRGFLLGEGCKSEAWV